MKLHLRRTKLLYQSGPRGKDLKSDPVFPYELEVSFSPPDFAALPTVLMNGGYPMFVVAGRTRKAVMAYAGRRKWLKHPKLFMAKLALPDGTTEYIHSALKTMSQSASG